jgi:hypothetical protein
MLKYFILGDLIMPTGKNSSSDQPQKANQGSKTAPGKNTEPHGSHGSGGSFSIKSGTSGHSTGDGQKDKGREGASSSSTRGGTHEQHVEAGRQSHKNR